MEYVVVEEVTEHCAQTVGERIDGRGDEGEQVGQDTHGPRDLPVDDFAGDQHTSKPGGEVVHGDCTPL
jgi:hypothetical protein